MKFKAQRHFIAKALPKHRFGVAKKCYWCGVSLAYKGRFGPTHASREHLVPRFYGGKMGANIAAACHRCNQVRGHETDWVPWHGLPKETRRMGCPMRSAGSDLQMVLDAMGKKV